MWNKIIMGLGALMATALTAALGIDIYEHRQIAKKVGVSVKDLKEASVKEIQQGIVESAVKEAAEDKVGVYIHTVRDDIIGDARNSLDREARKAVSEAEDLIRKEVEDKISKEASKIDMNELKKSARDKAEAKILEKFDGNLEDLLEKFNDNLGNIQKIYGGIADAISKGQEQNKGLKFTIG